MSEFMHASLNLSMFLAVAVGGAIGSMLRYGLSQWITIGADKGFPTAIMIINIAGSFVMGLVVMVLADKFPPNHTLRLFLTVGLLGGFTTFSTFALDIVGLVERGATMMAISYGVFSVGLSVIAMIAGLSLGKMIS